MSSMSSNPSPPATELPSTPISPPQPPSFLTTDLVPGTVGINGRPTSDANHLKRKPSRRPNTAERRATHNAVERQRRETLNGRFLDLASLLPNLTQIRRPSKSSIVNSSIAHIHASRRHRLLASRELRLLKAEADALRREINEWRHRAGVPRIDEPIRGEGFSVIISAAELELENVIGEEEDGDDISEGRRGSGYEEDEMAMQQQQHQAAQAHHHHQQQQPPQHHHHQRQQMQVPLLDTSPIITGPPLVASPTQASFENPAIYTDPTVYSHRPNAMLGPQAYMMGGMSGMPADPHALEMANAHAMKQKQWQHQMQQQQQQQQQQQLYALQQQQMQRTRSGSVHSHPSAGSNGSPSPDLSLNNGNVNGFLGSGTWMGMNVGVPTGIAM